MPESVPAKTDLVAAGESERPERGRRATSFAGPNGPRLYRLPQWVWIVFAILAGIGYLSANGWLTAYAIAVLPVLATLLLRESEPPVLLFACGMQWLQASVAVFYTNFYGAPVAAMYQLEEVKVASYLSITSIVILAFGINVAIGGQRPSDPQAVEDESRRLKPGTILTCYLIAFIGLSFITRLAIRIPALSQPLLATSSLRWVLVYLLAQAVLSQRRNYALLAIAVVLEFFTGVIGYFSSFKGIFFVLLVVLLGSRQSIRSWRLGAAIGVGVMLLGLGIMWTLIKSDYREFLNQGTRQQAVMVPISERVNKLGELVGGLDSDLIEEGLSDLIIRVSYVRFFALSIVNVPAYVPHEKGRLWLGAFKHVLMPRFLFPGKESLDDSRITEKYTGLQVAGAEEGTSIGIGYVGESYIDFGRLGMFAPIFLLGVFYGLIYRFFCADANSLVLGGAFATAVLIFGAYTIETSSAKLIGGNLMALVVMGVFAKAVGGGLWQMIARPTVPAHPAARRSRRRRRAAASESEA